MTETAVEIHPFDLAGATDQEYAALNRFENRMKAERMPEDPTTPLEETVASLKNIPGFVTVSAWAAWDADRTTIVGSANVGFLNTEENKHLVQFDVAVLPEQRRRGLGRRLLQRVADVPQREGRRLMLTGTNGRVPAGVAFAARVGGEKALEGHTNQLVLADLDPALLDRWTAPEQAGGFTLDLWTGAYPDSEIDALSALWEVMNTMPRDALDVEDMHFTPAQMRQMEQSLTASGTERWTLAARETATGAFAGITEVFWNPNRPEIVNQGGTGVFPDYRGHGLGRRLKAAMLRKVRQERPEARYVRTGNADSNGPMLHINQELGFRPYLSTIEWQIETAKVLAYLGE